MTTYCMKNKLSYALINRLRSEYVAQMRKEARCW